MKPLALMHLVRRVNAWQFLRLVFLYPSRGRVMQLHGNVAETARIRHSLAESQRRTEALRAEYSLVHNHTRPPGENPFGTPGNRAPRKECVL